MRNFKKFGISLLVCSICALLLAWARGVFAQTAPVSVFHILSDCFLAVGIVASCIALLIFVSNEGTFDIFVYGLRVFWGFFRKGTPLREDTFFDYRETRQGKKVPFAFLLSCGGIFLLLSILMYLAYRIS